mmetsp:Transcript_11053/g.21918  ORF Transcript_11053/g.21918 Transcript_11053/m.21918 type:complete len:278 (+) Transcript_11053:1893-2726(+)
MIKTFCSNIIFFCCLCFVYTSFCRDRAMYIMRSCRYFWTWMTFHYHHFSLNIILITIGRKCCYHDTNEAYCNQHNSCNQGRSILDIPSTITRTTLLCTSSIGKSIIPHVFIQSIQCWWGSRRHLSSHVWPWPLDLLLCCSGCCRTDTTTIIIITTQITVTMCATPRNTQFSTSLTMFQFLLLNIIIMSMTLQPFITINTPSSIVLRRSQVLLFIIVVHHTPITNTRNQRIFFIKSNTVECKGVGVCIAYFGARVGLIVVDDDVVVVSDGIFFGFGFE